MTSTLLKIVSSLSVLLMNLERYCFQIASSFRHVSKRISRASVRTSTYACNRVWDVIFYLSYFQLIWKDFELDYVIFRASVLKSFLWTACILCAKLHLWRTIIMLVKGGSVVGALSGFLFDSVVSESLRITSFNYVNLFSYTLVHLMLVYWLGSSLYSVGFTCRWFLRQE